MRNFRFRCFLAFSPGLLPRLPPYAAPKYPHGAEAPFLYILLILIYNKNTGAGSSANSRKPNIKNAKEWRGNLP
ncbi:hypothetical protein DPQ25_09575 [Hydrogeniiclostridium mannosilyticum]|uniref:Uncharacterized protein n=1 Tax=Hydrogeniiclostridium mannosilyticum TaxID=2764322 RepID=A0A328UBQ0_9FIRM|nr:hypothetical protein DPQ25_09575 [Hydrogeniiclostridium mannosilyticum]